MTLSSRHGRASGSHTKKEENEKEKEGHGSRRSTYARWKREGKEDHHTKKEIQVDEAQVSQTHTWRGKLTLSLIVFIIFLPF
jgi:hypothetical protein